MDSRALQDERPHDEHEKNSVLKNPHDEHEKKSVLKKVKAKAKKIKDTITKPKHGHHDDNEHGHDQYHYENQHIPDDHDLDQEDDEDDQDPEIHGARIYDSATVINVAPQGQGVNLGGTSIIGEEHHHHEPTRTFVKEERTMLSKINLEEDPHAPGSRFEAYAPANYQTKVTDPTGTGGAEIDITLMQKSMDRMSKQNEPKTLATIAETQYPSPCIGIHSQFPPEFSTATKTPYPSSTIAHDQNLPQLSSEIKTQYPKSHDQFTPVFNTSTPTQHPSHDQNLTHISNVTKTQYPYDQNLPHISDVPKTQYPSSATNHHFTPQHHFATSHDKHLPQYFNETKTTSMLIPTEPKPPHSLPPYSGAVDSQAPSAGRHDQFKPELLPIEPKPQHYSRTSHDTYLPPYSGAMGSQYPSAGSHDQFKSELPPTEPKPQHQYATYMPRNFSTMKTQYPPSESHDQFKQELLELKPQHSSATSHDTYLPLYSGVVESGCPSIGSHVQFKPELPTEHIPRRPFNTSHEQPLPQYSSATEPKLQHQSVTSLPQHTSEIKTQYSSSGSHDQFRSELPTEHHSPQHFSAMKTQYPSAGTPEFSTDNRNLTVEEQPQLHRESIETSSNQSNDSYTDKIYSAASAIADKAADAKNTVASKLGYSGGENETTPKPTGETQSNQSSYTDKISSAASAAVDKAATAKDMVASKLGYGGENKTTKITTGETPSNQSSLTEKISSATYAAADKAATAKDIVASKLGYGDKGETPSNQNSYTEKISSATSAAVDKAAAAKDMVASKLGYGEKGETNTGEIPSDQSSYTEKISSATSAATDKVTTAKDKLASKLGYGEKGETTTCETPSNQNQNQNQSSYTEKISSATSAIADKAASAKNTVASKLGFGEKGETEIVSPAEYGDRIAVSLTEKLSPVTGVENERESGFVKQDIGVSIKDYVSEKLIPGENDRALSETISESLYKNSVDDTVKDVYEYDEGKGSDVRKFVSDAVHKRGDDVDEGRRKPVRGKVTESEEVKKRLGGWDDEIKEGELGKGMVDMVKDTVESWFGKPGENEPTQGSGGERRLQESAN